MDRFRAAQHQYSLPDVVNEDQVPDVRQVEYKVHSYSSVWCQHALHVNVYILFSLSWIDFHEIWRT